MFSEGSASILLAERRILRRGLFQLAVFSKEGTATVAPRSLFNFEFQISNFLQKKGQPRGEDEENGGGSVDVGFVVAKPEGEEARHEGHDEECKQGDA